MKLSFLFVLVAFGAQALAVDNIPSKTTYSKAYGETKNPVTVDPAKDLPRYPAVEPQDAVATWKIKKGFRLELEAHEPQVRSPISRRAGPGRPTQARSTSRGSRSRVLTRPGYARSIRATASHPSAVLGTETAGAASRHPPSVTPDRYRRSKRSASMTFTQAATKSSTNCCSAPSSA